MKSTTIIILIVAILAVAAIGYFLFKKNYQSPSSTGPSPSQPETVTPIPSITPTGNGQNGVITISNFAFNPQIDTITAGTTVKWINEDNAPHKIKSDTFNSETLSKGDSYEFTFTTKGTYSYSCAIHPFMTGQIIVQ